MSEDEVSTGEEVGKPFTVHVYEGSELTDDVIERLKIRDVLASDFNNDQERITDIINGYRKPHSALYVVQSPSTESAIGIMQVHRWIREESEWGNKFWSEVDNIDSEMGQIASKAVVLSSARTLPDWQRKGVQKSLLREITAKENPDVILGDSRNPAAVMSRSTVTSDNGYKTFLDMVDVSPGASEEALDEATHTRILACTVAFILQSESMFGSVIEEEQGLLVVAHPVSSPQEPPNVEGFPKPVKNAFGNLIAVQQKVNQDTSTPPLSVVAPLVSIRRGLLSGKN